MADGDFVITRRRFFGTSAAALAAAPLITPGFSGMLAAFTDQEKEKTPAAPLPTLRLGLIGCGGRGTGAAVNALQADEGVVLTAMADVLRDRLEGSLAQLKKEPEAARVQVDERHRFLGFDAYQKLLASDVDVVILTTPPVFRPAQLAATVAAGKHVFCEKPVAVDAPGVRSILDSVAAAREKQLSIVSGLCWRYSAAERATFAKILDGAIGAVRSVYTTYNTGPLGKHPRKPEWTDMEWQIRNWYHFRWLSGDHIVEQAVHSIDKMAWALGDQLPERAVAVGGRQARTGPESGNIYDHFSVTYEFPGDVRGFHMCRQIANCPYDNTDHIMGEKGFCDINGWAPSHVITGANPWSYDGEKNDMYLAEHQVLFRAIRSGKPVNDGVRMANSTLMAIMGRMAAYTGQTITWKQALDSKESLTPAKLEWGEVPIGPVAIPGKTKFS